ncbi:MAG: helix-turn-helix transcriptional regulator [Clostridia bacterium]|nr:helix-turn-helix transcriptional regulator [Clostridia bacterium]
MLENICKFASTKKPEENINIINFVYEQKAAFNHQLAVFATYSIALVTEGTGILHTSLENHNLKKGSLFFTFSAKPYYIENTDNLKYMYISFIGQRAITLFDRLHITYNSPVFDGFDFLIDLWKETLMHSKDANTDLFCEGLLLYTMAFICKKDEESVIPQKKNGILLVKEYIDANYTDKSLTLKTVSEEFFYNPKYLSYAFQNLVRIKFSDYLKERRLSHAKTLLENGISNIADVAELSGFSDPVYFSKLFKQKYGVSPKKYKTAKVK